MSNTNVDLPEWTESAGGRECWRTWIEAQVKRCCRRAAKWVKARGDLSEPRPTTAEWRQAIVAAVHRSRGRGAYSDFPLSMASPRQNTDWNWPSVDHLRTPNVAEVAIETRLVNDVKGIMTEEEFCNLIAHLAFVMKLAPHENSGWQCGRSFTGPEPLSEPPLPD